MSAIASEYGHGRFGDQLEIEQHGPAVDVIHVHGHPLGVSRTAATRRLPLAAQAGRDAEKLSTLHPVHFQLGGNDRPRADQCHVAAQNIEELWQLIEARLTQESADRCDPGVVLKFEAFAKLGKKAGILGKYGLGIHHHRPELQAIEHLIVPTEPLLAKKDWARTCQGDKERDDQHQRGQSQQECRRRQNVEKALKPPEVGLIPEAKANERAVVGGKYRAL